MSDDVQRTATIGFLLGLRVSQSINNLPPPDRIRYTALIEILQEIAGGGELSLETDADLRRLQPSAAHEELQRDYRDLQKDIASTVLKRLALDPKGSRKG